jgi:hypothetical protein
MDEVQEIRSCKGFNGSLVWESVSGDIAAKFNPTNGAVNPRSSVEGFAAGTFFEAVSPLPLVEFQELLKDASNFLLQLRVLDWCYGLLNQCLFAR